MQNWWMDEDAMLSLILISETCLLIVQGASNKRSKSVSVNIHKVVHYMWSHPQLEHRRRLLALFINCFLNIYVCMCYTFLKLNTGLKLFSIKIFPSAVSILIFYDNTHSERSHSYLHSQPSTIQSAIISRSNLLLNTYQICLLFHSSVTIVFNSPFFFFCLNYYNNNNILTNSTASSCLAPNHLFKYFIRVFSLLSQKPFGYDPPPQCSMVSNIFCDKV